MFVKQISIFIPNKKGSLAHLTDVLVAHEIDIRAIAVFDTTEFGILRLIVSNPDKAIEVLKEEGLVAKVSKVLAVNPEDKPGSLNQIFNILRDYDINVEYVYSFVMRQREMPYIVLKVDKEKEAADALTANNIVIVNKEEIYNN